MFDAYSKYEVKLHQLAGQEADSDRVLFLDDDHSQINIVEGIAKLKSECQGFVQARCMRGKCEKTFKPPTNIGKISGLKAAIVTVDGGMVEDQLTKQENSWIFKAWNMYEEPLTLVLQGIIDEADPDDDADADDADTLADTCSQGLVVDVGAHLSFQHNIPSLTIQN